jgi:hypothetical protein
MLIKAKFQNQGNANGIFHIKHVTFIMQQLSIKSKELSFLV